MGEAAARPSPLTREACVALDRQDALAPVRDAFTLPAGTIYLDGNSLGALPHRAADAVERVVRKEWGVGLIRSWNDAGWMDAPLRVGDKLGRLLGADPGEVAVADSTSITLFKLLTGAVQAAGPDRRVILTEDDNFPTDLYVAGSAARLLGPEVELSRVPRAGLEAALGPDVAVLMLTHADFKTGYLHDMASLTAAAHEAGALVLWDLSHSAGAVPVDLNSCRADLALGCGYKYLNGGPGAPAFLFVSKRHHASIPVAVAGWMGHARPFEFEPGFTPASGIRRYVTGTPSILGIAALEAGVDIWLEVDPTAARRKSLALTELFIDLVEARCAGFGVDVVTPRQPERRGSQVSLRHPAGYPVMRALIERGVIGDFRAPDLMRFGFAALYTRFVDAWDAVDILREVLSGEAWRDPALGDRLAVT